MKSMNFFKKIKFYIIFYGIVLCISIFGISIGVGVAKLQEVHPEYLSIGLIKGVVVFLFALFISVGMHEATHAIIFKLQSVGVRMIYQFPICIVKENGRYKISFAFNLQIGLGGIVIPKIPVISNEEEYKIIRKKIGLSLIGAPLMSVILGIIALALVCFTTKYIPDDILSYYFVFLVAIIFWSIYINGMSLLNLGTLVGDYCGAKKMKTDEVYSLLQIYNYFLLQENKIKEITRTTQRFLIERIKQEVETLPLDNNSGTMNFLLADALLYEMIIEPKEHMLILTEVDKLNDIISCIQEKFQFESYSSFLCHIIIYLKLCGNSDGAMNLWKMYYEKMAKTKSGTYRLNQTKLSLFENSLNVREFNKSIEISSMDSLLSKFSNYYDDEKYINNMLAENFFS